MGAADAGEQARSSEGLPSNDERGQAGKEPKEVPVLDETLPADRAGWEEWADATADGSTETGSGGQPSRG